MSFLHIVLNEVYRVQVDIETKILKSFFIQFVSKFG